MDKLKLYETLKKDYSGYDNKWAYKSALCVWYSTRNLIRNGQAFLKEYPS